MEAQARELAALCRHLHARGWVANHDGNVSHRLGDGRFLCSPTAVSKADVGPECLVVVDDEGKVVQGERRVFSEISLHLAAYRARPDVAWVVHAHPPTATGWAVAGEAFFDPPFMAEPVVSLGECIPLVSATELPGAIAACDAVLLANHGVLTVAKDPETARLRMELVEHLARIALAAKQAGGIRPIPAEDVAKLLESRRKAGLGPGAKAVAPVAAAAEVDVDALVREALRRVG